VWAGQKERGGGGGFVGGGIRYDNEREGCGHSEGGSLASGSMVGGDGGGKGGGECGWGGGKVGKWTGGKRRDWEGGFDGMKGVVRHGG